ncbi:hypothetical protein KAU43_07670 [candidate division WOR-3 bacterium]|nr:hypothetical protein [candidate division WOR-3 bacterium]
MDWLQPAMMIMVIAMVGLMVFNMMKGMFGKKKPTMIQIARDSNERLEKAYKIMVKGKLNNDRMRHTLWISGDKMIQGYRVGDIVGIQPQNEMLKMHIKTRWWYFWKKAVAIYIDPILCSDLNTPDIVVQAKGFEAVTGGLVFPIPVSSTKNLEAIYVGRDNFRMARIHKQTMDDLNQDADFLLKMAMRGDLDSAGNEISRPDSMAEIEEKKIKKAQERNYRDELDNRSG